LQETRQIAVLPTPWKISKNGATIGDPILQD